MIFFHFFKGEYRYIEDGTVIINSLDDLSKIEKAKLVGHVKKGNDTLKVSFSDPSRRELRHATINFVNGDQNRIAFKFTGEKNPQGLNKFALKPRTVYKGKIPRELNVILTRIE